MTMKAYDRRMSMDKAAERQKTSGEQMVEVAKKLHGYRRVFVALHGKEQLAEAVRTYRPYFDRICARAGCSILEALIVVLRQDDLTDGQRLLFGAVVTEIIEPSLG